MGKPVRIKGLKKSENPTLYATLKKMLIAYDLSEIRVFILPWGQNAAAISLFGDFFIITKKFLGILNEKELEAVVAHEFSPLYNRDSMLMLTVPTLFIIPALYLYSKINFNQFSLSQMVLFLLFLLFLYFSTKIRNWVSMLTEIRADRDAVLKTKNPKAMLSALLKFHFNPHEKRKRPSYLEKMLESFEYLSGYLYGFTHPSLKQRVENLELANKILATQKEWVGYRKHRNA